jgi:predicted DNA-binding transcriptional regulator YafY
MVHRLTRLLSIYDLLSEEPWTRRDLAARFSVSERRIQGDLAILRASGVVVWRVPKKRGYRAHRP